MSEKVSFRTHVELKSILGKDLITDDNIAVQELIKNSFDAGSTISKVEFIGIKHKVPPKDYRKFNNSQIVISDLGKGMNRYDLINKWLNIAYSEKKEIKEEYNRNLAGNKGVGRFSCDRLGKLLTIYTKKVNQPMLKLYIDWRTLEHIKDINLNIQDIKFQLDEISINEFKQEIELKGIHLEPFKSGTVLCIDSLREEWDRAKILSLKRQLEKLISPNQSFNSEKFEIEIVAKEYIREDIDLEEHQRLNGTVQNKIFENLDFRVTAIQSKVSRNGNHVITILKDRGRVIFTLVEKNQYNLLKDIKTHIYYLNPYSKTYFMKQTGIRTRDFGSISLFINGFRIPPYGDSGDDWLGMEARATQGTRRFLSTRDVVGRIEVNGNEETIDDGDEEFKIISSRSGVRDNRIFRQLAKSTSPFGFYYKAFRRLERFVVEGISWDSASTQNIEKLIEKDPDWDESKEKYKLDELTRNKQIVSVVEKIINAKQDEVIKLNINKSLVSDLIENQIGKLNSELKVITDEINNKEFSGEQIEKLISKLNKSKKDLDSFTEEIGKRTEEDLKSESKVLNLTKNQESLLNELNALKEKVEEERKARIAAEEAAERAAEELQLEKDRTTYLLSSKRTLSDDAKGMIHNVKTTSKSTKRNAEKLYKNLKDDRIKKNRDLKVLSTIIYNADKALKISNLITRANFKSNSDYQDVDIVKYIQQYFDVYNIIYDIDLTFSVINKEQIDSFEKRISILDLSMVFDDLISNSEKAGAENVQANINLTNEGDLRIVFSDDGHGVNDIIFRSNKDLMFELGITTTEGGSGIGLNFVRETLKKMKGTIDYIGNDEILAGASFQIIISKSY